MDPTLPLSSKQHVIVAISVLAAVFPATLVILRLSARRIANRPLNSSDYIIIPASICTVVYQFLVITSIVATGNSYHVTEVLEALGEEALMDFLKLLFTLQLLYTIAISMTKLSILELYRLIFPSTTMLYSCISTQAIVVMWALATVFVTLFMCQPIAYNWDLSIPDAKCGNTLASWKSTGIINIITDILVLILPIPALLKVRMAVYKKIIIIATFTLGVLTTAVGIARLTSIIHVDQSDITYTVAWAVVFSALECSVAVSLSCIPLLRPLLGRTKYSKNGTAIVQSTCKSGRRSINGKIKDALQQIDDDSSEIELRPHGSIHQAGITCSGDVAGGSNCWSDVVGKEDAMVHHRRDVAR